MLLKLKLLINLVLIFRISGKSGIIRLYRNRQLLQAIEEVENYDYNTPKMMEYGFLFL